MNDDLKAILSPYFDGLITAKDAMYGLVRIECNGREELRTHVYAWLENKLSHAEAIKRIAKSYNL